MVTRGRGEGVHPGVRPACWSPLLSGTKLHLLEGIPPASDSSAPLPSLPQSEAWRRRRCQALASVLSPLPAPTPCPRLPGTSFPHHGVLGWAERLGKCPIPVIRGVRELSAGNSRQVSWKASDAGGGGRAPAGRSTSAPATPLPFCGSLTATCPGTQRAQRPQGGQPRPVWLLILCPTARVTGASISLPRPQPPRTCGSARVPWECRLLLSRSLG